MKFVLSILIAFILIPELKAQHVIAPDSAASWIIYEEYGINAIDKYYFYTMPINDDTILGGVGYSKLYELPGTYPGSYKGAYRVDATGKVLFIPANDSIEVLLRDFNVLPGDTVKDIYIGFSGYISHHGSPNEILLDCIVDSLAYFNVGPHTLKAVYLSVDSGAYPSYYAKDLFWIEIVGNPIGGIFNLLHTGNGAGVPVDMYGLSCMSYQDTIYRASPFFIYYNPHFQYLAGICNMPTSIEISSIENLTIYPNPASATIQFEIPETGEYEINIYDTRGSNALSTTFEVTFEGDENCIDVGDLPTGMYFIEAVGEKTFRGRFIKE